MRITYIGAGNVATHLAPALAAAGHEVACVFSRTLESAELLASRVGPTCRPTNVLDDILPADVYIISVRDDVLPDVASRWPQHCRGGVVVHTAGTLPMSLLEGVSEHYGVLYPMQTFSKNKHLNFQEIPCFIEGNDRTSVKAIKGLAESVSQKVTELSSADRRFLHLGAVFACNFANHMFALGYEILEQHGIDPSSLRPLIEETASKLRALPPHEGQTGPARRNDKAVIAAQMEALAETPELQNLYESVTKSIVGRFHGKDDTL